MRYFHVVFTLPAAIAKIAWQNKAVVYDLLFKASAETLLTIAADPKHLGARIGITSVLHTWGSAMTHHPHVHMIVPGGGIALDCRHRIRRRPDLFLPVRVLSSLFRRLMLEKPVAAHTALRALRKRQSRRNLARMRELLDFAAPEPKPNNAAPELPEEQVQPCPCCGGKMRVIEIFQAGAVPRTAPAAVIRIETS